MDERNNIGVRIVMLFDIIVSIFVGIKCIPSGVHVILRILIIFAIFFAAFFIMNIKKFGIGLVAIIVWKWVLRACAFLICFLGHLKLTVWDEEIKDRFFE